jgi:excisionase family DNA binding protein
MPQELDRDFLTIKQASDYLGCSKDTIRRMIRDGKLPFSQLCENGVIRIKASSISRLMENSIKSNKGKKSQ